MSLPPVVPHSCTNLVYVLSQTTRNNEIIVQLRPIPEHVAEETSLQAPPDLGSADEFLEAGENAPRHPMTLVKDELDEVGSQDWDQKHRTWLQRMVDGATGGAWGKICWEGSDPIT